MLVAKYYGKPVVTVLPRDSAHRKSNTVFHGRLVEDWIHPFVFASSDNIVESAHAITLAHLLPESVKGLDMLDRSIEYFLARMGASA
jgi:hypothetical protein